MFSWSDFEREQAAIHAALGQQVYKLGTGSGKQVLEEKIWELVEAAYDNINVAVNKRSAIESQVEAERQTITGKVDEAATHEGGKRRRP